MAETETTTTKPTKKSDTFCTWFVFFCIIVVLPTIIAVPSVINDRAYRKTYITTYSDADCLTAPKGVIRPPDDGYCSTIDQNVQSYKFTKLGAGCSVWTYRADDPTCSALNSSQLLTWRQCILAPNNTHFVLQCDRPLQPYRDPSLPPPPITSSVGFKLGMGLGIPAFLYGLITLWIVVHTCRKRRKSKAQQSPDRTPSSVTLVSLPAEKTSNASKNSKVASKNSKQAPVVVEETTKV